MHQARQVRTPVITSHHQSIFYKYSQEGVPEDRHRYCYWFRSHGIHRILREADSHPNQQHHRRILILNIMPAALFWSNQNWLMILT